VEAQSFIESMPICLEDLTLKDCKEAIFGVISPWLATDLPPKLQTVRIAFEKIAVESRNIGAGNASSENGSG
jgi:hypothetical protein